MPMTTLLIASLILLTVGSTPLPTQAASTYHACSLLTSAELEGLLRQKVTKSGDSDVTVSDGPYKGETVSSCNWTLGPASVALSVMRGPRTPEQRAAGLAAFRRIEEILKKQGWTIDQVNVGGMSCSTYNPPTGAQGLPRGAACVTEAKGFALMVSVSGGTPQLVKGLVDKAAGRLP